MSRVTELEREAVGYVLALVRGDRGGLRALNQDRTAAASQAELAGAIAALAANLAARLGAEMGMSAEELLRTIALRLAAAER